MRTLEDNENGDDRILSAAGLTLCDPSMPGFSRVRRGKGFRYVDWSGREISDQAVLRRIDALTIPPAWTSVWICPLEEGHLQAVGLDAAGRKQYIYHERWRETRDAEKFDRMVRFARALPQVREIAHRDLALRGMPRERVLAAAVRLLDRGFFRIGSEEYAERNGTYGLATLRREHVKLGRDGELTFDYVAKAGKERMQAFVDPDVYAVVSTLKRRRDGGDELLAYKNGDGRWRDLRSEDVNSYLKDVAGEEYSAKDFRTWHATVLAAVALAVSTRAARSQSGSKRAVSRAVKEVSRYLGNTPAVCRRSYIDPRVVEAYLSGRTIVGSLEDLALYGDASSFALQEGIERSVLDLLMSESGREGAGNGGDTGAQLGAEACEAVAAGAESCEVVAAGAERAGETANVHDGRARSMHPPAPAEGEAARRRAA